MNHTSYIRHKKYCPAASVYVCMSGPDYTPWVLEQCGLENLGQIPYSFQLQKRIENSFFCYTKIYPKKPHTKGIKGLCFAQRATKSLGQSLLQEVEEGPCSRPYLLGVVKGQLSL